MKKLFTLVAYISLLLPVAFAQQPEAVLKPNLKYGKLSKEELSLSTYTPDTTATAIYLFHQAESAFSYHDGFQLITEHWVRIKILKPQGVSYADVSIPYYSPADKNEGTETATNIDGCSYNLENGVCVETPLKRDMIFFERVNDRTKLLKFSLPAVKTGTIIEYHYKVASDYFAHIDNWMMQEELPMIYNQYKLTVPNVFIYNMELRGKDFITIKEKETRIQGTTTEATGQAKLHESLSIPARQLTFTSEHLPAIRQDESYCWCPEDYKVQISFDLEGTQFPGREYEPYSQKWADVEKKLTNPEYEHFGKHLSLVNPFREDLRTLTNKEMSFEEKVITAFGLLKKKLAWNGRYELYSNEPEKVIKAGNGSNAELNFILISILKDYGFRAYPVVLSRRSTGILPVNFPSLQKLNTFVVAIRDTDNQELFYLDSSMDMPALNVLPTELSVEKARILAPTEAEENKWVSLIHLINNTAYMNINATMQGDRITGHRITQLLGQQAVEFRKRKQEQKQDAFGLESIDKEKLTVTNLNTELNESDFRTVKEELDFAMQAGSAGDRLYINPMLFPQLSKNPFIQTERVLPVEFAYPTKFNLMCSLTLPEGYEVEELPQSQAFRTEDDKLQCKYLVQREGNKVHVNYTFNIKTHLFPSDQYQQIQEIWTKVIEKNNALVVLKKL